MVDDHLLKVIAQVFNAIKINDSKTLKALVENHCQGHLNIFELRDYQGYNPLSLASFKNAKECFMILFDLAVQKANGSKEALKGWVD